MSRRSAFGVAAAAALLGAGAGGAFAAQRLAVTQTTGSEQSTEFLQSTQGGSALQGEVGSHANTTLKIPFAMLGEYDLGTAFGVGVAGISTTGYAVGAESLGESPALFADNVAGGDGLDVYSPSGEGIYAQSSDDAGYFYSTGGNGITTLTTSSGSASISAFDDAPANTGSIGLGSVSAHGMGAYIEGDSSTATVLETLTPAAGPPLIAGHVIDNASHDQVTYFLYSKSSNASGDVYTSNDAASDSFLNGDMYITGALYEDCRVNGTLSASNCVSLQPTAAVARGGGSTYGTYSIGETSPTLEDAGSARLVNGSAHVALDPTFASTLANTPYLVVATPHGDSHGVFVTNETPTGFDVRENTGGRSTVDFDYRILAKPYGNAAPRLPLVKGKSLPLAPGMNPSVFMRAHASKMNAVRQSHATHQALSSLVATRR